MNRRLRREYEKFEKARQKQAERILEKRKRAREAMRERRREVVGRFKLLDWLQRPYKALDMLVLFAVFWLLRTYLYDVMEINLASRVDEIAGALSLALVVFIVAAVLYVRRIAREPIGWSGMGVDEPVPPRTLLGVGAGAGLIAYSFGWLGNRVFMLTMPEGAEPVASTSPGIALPIDWAGMWSEQGAVAVLLTLAAYVLLAPVANELFYRRILMYIFMRNNMSANWTVFFTTILFALSSVDTLPPAYAAAGGAVFGFAYVRWASFGMVVIAHIVMAACVFLVGS